MKYLTTLISTLSYCSIALGQTSQKTDCLISYIDATSGKELVGYQTLDGQIIIPAQYLNGNDILCEMTFVFTSDFKFIGINKKGEAILEPYIYDNGPDYVEEGLFRYVDNGKIGFANQEGQKIIIAKYDFATPFSDGISEYSIGGEPIYENGKSRTQIILDNESITDRHWSWGGDIKESGYLNKLGQEFTKITELKNNKRLAWTLDNKKYILNQEGEIIKQMQ